METVSFFTFLEEKITEILFQLFFLALVAFLLIFYGVDMLFVVLLVILFISAYCEAKRPDLRSKTAAFRF